MCGIGGFRRFGNSPILPSMIKLMATELQSRGLDATGVAIQNGNEIHVCKLPLPAWKFCVTDEFNQFLDENLNDGTDAVLVHARAATQGPPKDSRNNHPCFNGETAVVHNGVVHNDSQLFREMNMERVGEVDSDVFRALLDRGGLTRKGIDLVKKVNGSAAIAALSTQYPGKLLLARSGSPLVVCAAAEMMIWASTKQAIHQCYRPIVQKFGINFRLNRLPQDAAFVSLPDHSAWLFDENGLMWHEEFKTAAYYNPRNYRVHEEWADKQARWNGRKFADVVFCSNEKCRRAHTIPDGMKNLALWEMECSKCKTPFADKPRGEA